MGYKNFADFKAKVLEQLAHLPQGIIDHLYASTHGRLLLVIANEGGEPMIACALTTPIFARCRVQCVAKCGYQWLAIRNLQCTKPMTFKFGP